VEVVASHVAVVIVLHLACAEQHCGWRRRNVSARDEGFGRVWVGVASALCVLRPTPALPNVSPLNGDRPGVWVRVSHTLGERPLSFQAPSTWAGRSAYGVIAGEYPACRHERMPAVEHEDSGMFLRGLPDMLPWPHPS
jgi:hypothetical protein